MKNKPKYWIDKLFSSSNGVSSKRVAGLFTLVHITVFCYLALFRDLVLPDFMFEAICILCGSLLGITAVENIFRKDNTPPTDETTQ